MPKSDNRRKKEKLKGRKKRAPRASVAEIDLERPKLHQGVFQAPCGSMVAYITPMELPSMEEYRSQAISDHIVDGECPAPEICGGALATGEFRPHGRGRRNDVLLADVLDDLR